MIVAADAEDLIIRREVDFDHHVARGHFFQQADGIFLLHHVDAVADAFGVAALDRGANVKREVFGLHQSLGDFTGVQGDVNLGIDAVQVVEHRHVLVEIVNGDVPVFGHDQVQADEARIG